MTEQWMPSELGGPVGLARENVNRQLRPWRHEGLSRMDHGQVMPSTGRVPYGDVRGRRVCICGAA